MTANPVLWDLDARGVATVTLNRPEVNNAYDAGLINGVLAAMDELGSKPHLRVVVLKGNGKHFQAGADLKWINGVRPKSADENEAVSRATFEAVQRLNTLPIPTVALVQGGCFGGGTGVISACDVVIAADNALFSITEVRWGLTAAIIIPQLCDAIGVRQVRRYALTGERFGADEARRIGLVHEVVALAELEAAGAKVVEQLLGNGPQAMAETKALAMESSFGGMGVDDEAYARLVKMHSERRQTREASEGLASFAEKRAANWGTREANSNLPSKRIAIAGLGEIGKTVARKLAQGLPGLALAAITTRDRAKAQAWLDREGIACPLVSLDDLPAHADLVVECAPAAILDQICRPMLSAGKQVMVLSASALLPRPDLVDLARAHGGQIIVPTGALIGFDAVSAAAEGTINSVQMVTRKPPGGSRRRAHLVENGISMEGLKSALCVFKGSARDAAAAFPANVNVVAALSLAGIGPIARRSKSGPIRR